MVFEWKKPKRIPDVGETLEVRIGEEVIGIIPDKKGAKIHAIQTRNNDELWKVIGGECLYAVGELKVSRRKRRAAALAYLVTRVVAYKTGWTPQNVLRYAMVNSKEILLDYGWDEYYTKYFSRAMRQLKNKKEIDELTKKAIELIGYVKVKKEVSLPS